MQAVDYILGIDWLGGVAVAAVLGLVGLVLLRFLMATTSRSGTCCRVPVRRPESAAGRAGHAGE